MDTLTYSYIVLPLVIFLARIVDVSIGTMRIIYVSKGMKAFAAVCGFFEVLVWLMALTQIMQSLNNVVMFIAYAGGYSAGNYVGVLLENRLAVGMVALRIISVEDASELITELRKRNYGVTTIAANGMSGDVRLIFTVVKRKCIDEIVRTVKEFNPRAFVSVEEVKMVSNGLFLPSESRPAGNPWRLKTAMKWK